MDHTKPLTEGLPSRELFKFAQNKGAEIAWRKFARKCPAVARYVEKTPGQTARDQFLFKATKARLRETWDNLQSQSAGDSAAPCTGAASSSSGHATAPSAEADPSGQKRGLSQHEAESSPTVKAKTEPAASVSISPSPSPSPSPLPPSAADLVAKARSLLSGTSHGSTAGDTADFHSVCSEVSFISDSEVRRLERDVQKWNFKSRQSRATELGRRSQSLRREPLDIDHSSSSGVEPEESEEESFEPDPVIEEPDSPKGASIPVASEHRGWTRTDSSAGYGRWTRRSRSSVSEVDPSDI